MASLKQYKQQFLEYVEIERGRSLHTVRNYDLYLSRFLEFLKKDGPADVTDGSVREFRLWLNRQPTTNIRKTETLSKRTQNYYLIALRAFLKYLARQGVKSLSSERIELAKVSERSLDLINPTELSRLLKGPEGSDVKALRDRAILELLFSTGLRVSELCALPRDIDLKSDELSIRGKGGKVRVVFLSDLAKSALKAYLDKRKDMSDALFVRIRQNEGKTAKKSAGKSAGAKNAKSASIPDKPLDRHSIEMIVRHYTTKAGISKKVTPHTLRHMEGKYAAQIFIHVTDKHLRDIHKRYHRK